MRTSTQTRRLRWKVVTRTRAFHGPLALIAMTAAATLCRAAPELAVETVILPASTDAELREPALAMDPANPKRLLVAAMYGGTQGIWAWRSADGGRSWRDNALEAPKFPGIEAQTVFAADVIAGFGRDGSPLLTWLHGRPAGGTFVSRLSMDSPAVQSVPALSNTYDATISRHLLQDKPWMVVDHSALSPHRGSIYVTVSDMPVRDQTARAGTRWAMDEVLKSRLMLAVSRDNGKTFAVPKLISADSAFAGYLALTPDGALEITYLRITSNTGAGNAVLHQRSVDGGATFEPVAVIAEVKGEALLASQVIGARPNGDLLTCWSQGAPTDVRNQVKCSLRRSGQTWSKPRDIQSALAPDVVPSWPTVAGTERGWYLMLYLAGPKRTEVALFRTPDGEAFTKVATLTAIDGLGADRFCPSLWSPLRHAAGAFSIGHYVSLDATRNRLAAAYVFPRARKASGPPAIYVSTLAEPTN